jgi:hypothetical protein
MSDLIPLAELLAEIDREIKRVPACAATLQRARSIALTIPTIDAEPVVRCVECRFSKPIPEHAAKAFNADLVLDCTYQRGDWEQVYGFSVVSVDGYCDEGERRDKNNGKTD